MKFRKNIKLKYLPSKPIDPVEGDCYQDSFADGGYWVFYGDDWYWTMGEDFDDLIKESRNKKINNLLDDK